MASPTNVSGLVGRWIGDSVTSGTTIETWAASAGTDMVQPTSDNRPTRVASFLNGHTAIRFTGDDYMTSAQSYLTGTVGSFYFIGALRAAPVSNTRYFSARNTGNADDWATATQIIGHTSNGPRFAAYRNATNYSGGEVTVNASFVGLIVADGTNITIFINGTQVYQAASTGTFNINQIMLGAGWESGAVGAYSQIDVVEFGVHNAAYTTQDRAEIDAYTQDTYGITVSDCTAVTSKNDADTSESIETVVMSATLTAPDQGSGLDAASSSVIADKFDYTESGVGVSGQALAVHFPQDIAGEIGEETPATRPATTELPAGVENVTLTVAISAGDIVAALDAVAGLETNNGADKAASEAPTASDTASLIALVNAGDSATATDAASMAATMAASEAANSTEVSGVLGHLTGGDSASANFLATLEIASTGTEGGASAESATLAVQITAGDIVSAVEAVHILARSGVNEPVTATDVVQAFGSEDMKQSTESSGSTDAAFLLATVGNAEATGSNETASISAHLMSGDVVSVAESATVYVALSVTELAQAIEAVISAREVPSRTWRTLSASIRTREGREMTVAVSRMEA